MTSSPRAMSFDEVLAGRSMCRDFSPEPFEDAALDAVLRSAFRAPSAGNTAALDLLVLRDDDVAAYWDVSLPLERRDAFPWPGLLDAPVLILPIIEASAYVRRYGEPDKTRTGLGRRTEDWDVPYWWVDGGAAVMAMLLSATAQGLGALFFGQFEHEPALREAFGVPGDRRCVGTVAVGRPAPNGRNRSASALRGRPDPARRVHLRRW